MCRILPICPHLSSRIKWYKTGSNNRSRWGSLVITTDGLYNGLHLLLLLLHLLLLLLYLQLQNLDEFYHLRHTAGADVYNDSILVARKSLLYSIMKTKLQYCSGILKYSSREADFHTQTAAGV